MRAILTIVLAVWVISFGIAFLASNDYPRGYTEERGGLLSLGCQPSGKNFIFQKDEVVAFPFPHLEQRSIKVYHYKCSNIHFDMFAPYPEV